MSDEKIEPGQVWICDSIDDLPPLVCFVGRVDLPAHPERQSNIVSVFVSPHPKARENGWQKVSHLPIAEECFRQSALQLFKSGSDVPEVFERGYAEWKSKFHTREAGVFSVKLSEAYGGIAKAIRDNAAK